ncbi:MAG: hypothetical protein SFZ02_00650 [bacterium]|nr:hypothetical protein [bacterium]
MDKFLINQIGKITQGQYKDWYVLIEPYEQEDEMFLILICNYPSFKKGELPKELEAKAIGYDSFAQNIPSLLLHIEDWHIDWDWKSEN